MCTIGNCGISFAGVDFAFRLAVARTLARAVAFEADDNVQQIRPQIVLMRTVQMLMRKITARGVR